MPLPNIAVVTRETRLEGLRARWATAGAAAFRLQQAVEHEAQHRRRALAVRGGGKVAQQDLEQAQAFAEELADSDVYQEEDEAYRQAHARLLKELDLGFPLVPVSRSFLPNFDFARCLAIVVLGQDGLVANTAKYAFDLPIIGVNPDPTRNDGLLLPFEVPQARSALRRVIDRKAKTRSITLAEVNTNDGQRMLAFNDFFVGASSHVSARYTLEIDARHEQQSSSGVLVSTGAGSTGWLSSLYNMTAGFSRFAGGPAIAPQPLKWEDRRLVWAVREPFRSKHSGAELVAGFLEQNEELVIGSQMPTEGIIFSDGIQADYLEFNSGTIARFSVSSQQAKLVVG